MNTIKISADKPIVILQEEEYRRIIDKIEYLEDLLDHEQAMKEYRTSGGKRFRDLLETGVTT